MFQHDNQLARDISRVLTAVEGTTQSIVEAEKKLGIAIGTVHANDMAGAIFQCTLCRYWVGTDLKWTGDLCEGCVCSYGGDKGLIEPLVEEE